MDKKILLEKLDAAIFIPLLKSLVRLYSIPYVVIELQPVLVSVPVMDAVKGVIPLALPVETVGEVLAPVPMTGIFIGVAPPPVIGMFPL